MKKKIAILALFLFITPLLSLTADEDDDWPMFRHDPQHTGYTDCEMLDELELLWRNKVGDYVASSPVVVDGKVYVGSDKKHVYCFNMNTGNLIWKHEVKGWIYHSCPAIVNGKLYVGSDDWNIYCLNAYTGKLLWKHKTSDEVWSSPSVVNGKVYIGSRDSYLYCLNANTGEIVWKYKTGGWVNPSPAVVNDKVYIGSEDSYLYCLNANTGELVWKYKIGNYGIFSSPAVVNGKVYMGSTDSYVYCFNANTGEVIWKYKTDGAIHFSSPAVASGRVYVGSDDGYLYCLNVSTGKLIRKYKTGDLIWSSPVVCNSKVYVGSWDHYIYCFDANKKKTVWKYKTGAQVDSSPAVTDRKVYVGSCDGYLYCFGSKKETPSPTTTPAPTQSSSKTIFIGCPFSEEWPTPPYKCLKDLWWEDSNKNGVLDLSESREEVYLNMDAEKVEYRSVIEKEPEEEIWYGGEDNETPYFLITNPATVKFLGNFYNIIYCNEGEGYFVCATPHWSWGESTSEDILYFEVGKTISFYGWEITLKDINIYEKKVKWLIKSPKDEEPTEYPVVLSQPCAKEHNVIGIEERIRDQKFTVFALDTVKMYIGAGGENAVGAIVYVLTDIELIDSNITLSEKDLEILANIAEKIENYNVEIPISLGSEYTIRTKIEKKDIEFNPDGEEEYVISLASEKLKTVVPTPPPTTTPASPTTVPATSSPMTTPKSTTPTPTTPPPSTTTTSPQKSSSPLYIGLFIAVIVLTLAVYQTTKKKPEKIKEKSVEKEKLSPERIEEIKTQIEEKKKYIENYKKIIEQDPSKKEMAKKLIQQYEGEIKELERQVGK